MTLHGCLQLIWRKLKWILGIESSLVYTKNTAYAALGKMLMALCWMLIPPSSAGNWFILVACKPQF